MNDGTRLHHQLPSKSCAASVSISASLSSLPSASTTRTLSLNVQVLTFAGSERGGPDCKPTARAAVAALPPAERRSTAEVRPKEAAATSASAAARDGCTVAARSAALTACSAAARKAMPTRRSGSCTAPGARLCEAVPGRRSGGTLATGASVSSAGVSTTETLTAGRSCSPVLLTHSSSTPCVSSAEGWPPSTASGGVRALARGMSRSLRAEALLQAATGETAGGIGSQQATG